jgi:hypothetical protein
MYELDAYHCRIYRQIHSMMHKSVLCRIYLAYINNAHLGLLANSPYIFVTF